jgi:hypothetical protein
MPVSLLAGETGTDMKQGEWIFFDLIDDEYEY